MKKVLLLATLMFNVAAIDYTYVNCAREAQEICSELKDRKDFNACYYSQLEWCVADAQGEFGFNKSVPGCFKQCSFIADEAHREMCYRTCTEK